jgi:hypothetical protein
VSTIPHADKIRSWQAPSTDKLLGRCENIWRVATAQGIRGIKLTQQELKVPIMGETEEQVNEAIQILKEKDLGYHYYSRTLTTEEQAELNEDGDTWTSAYLVFKW